MHINVNFMSFPTPRIYAIKQLLPVVIVVGTVLILGALGDWLNPFLRYERDAIISGQIWRVITGHTVHLGMVHTLMNLTGMLLILHLFGRLLTLTQWVTASVLIGVGISAGFLVLNPELAFYAGLSGVLHGCLVLALFLAFWCDKRQPRWLTVMVLAVVIGKLISEQLPGYDVNYLYEQMEAAVIVDAHLYGAVIGTLLAPYYIMRHSH